MPVSLSSRRVQQQVVQGLLLKRFAMAAASYVMTALICAVAMLTGLLQVPLLPAVLVAAAVVLSQLIFLGLFVSGRNLRFRDPSLTEAQVLVAFLWLTLLLSQFHEGRGSLLVGYVLVLLFGVFQLPPRVFARCSFVGFSAFAALNLHEAFSGEVFDVALASLQLTVLGIVMLWLSLFASYVQALRRGMRQRRYALQAHQDTLRGMMRQLEDLAATDELTGLFNRRHFLRLAKRELASLREGRELGLALIDLDHFKRINDVHGHAAGDRVLQTFASVAQACLRDGDVIARYGGEEFVLLLPNAEAGQLAACCERLREAFSQAEPLGVQVGPLSLSVGMTLLGRGDDLDAALQRADQALYQAKGSGRNRCAASWETADA